jgi:ribosomal protein S18 acetylase RimI-like enzyme
MPSGQPKSLDIRRATSNDVPALSVALARAFADDGMTDWICGPRGTEPDDRRNLRTASLFEGYLRCLSLPHGMVYTVPAVNAGALWSPPGKWQLGFLAQMHMTPYFFAATGLARLPTRFLAAQKILGQHPHEPHFYLQVLGVDPMAQGYGWGSRLLDAGLREVDAVAMPAYLETMNDNNIPFYQRHGFRLTGELRLPYTGHRVWFMWRDARR